MQTIKAKSCLLYEKFNFPCKTKKFLGFTKVLYIRFFFQSYLSKGGCVFGGMFVAVFVCKITATGMDGFCRNFEEISTMAPGTSDSSLLVIQLTYSAVRMGQIEFGVL